MVGKTQKKTIYYGGRPNPAKIAKKLKKAAEKKAKKKARAEKKTKKKEAKEKRKAEKKEAQGKKKEENDAKQNKRIRDKKTAKEGQTKRDPKTLGIKKKSDEAVSKDKEKKEARKQKELEKEKKKTKAIEDQIKKMFEEDYQGWPKEYKDAIKNKALTFCVSEGFDVSKLKDKNKRKRDQQIKLTKREIYDERFKQEKLKFCSKHLGLIGMEDVTGPLIGMINICRYKGDKKAKDQDKAKGELLSKIFSELIFKTYTGKDKPAEKPKSQKAGAINPKPPKIAAKPPEKGSKAPKIAAKSPEKVAKSPEKGSKPPKKAAKSPEKVAKPKEGEKMLERIKTIATIVFNNDKKTKKKGSLLTADQIKKIEPNQISCDKGPKIKRTKFGRDKELINMRREERQKEAAVAGKKILGIGPRKGGIVGKDKQTAKNKANQDAKAQIKAVNKLTKKK